MAQLLALERKAHELHILCVPDTIHSFTQAHVWSTVLQFGVLILIYSC